ncbi:hypothetical protein IV203_037442 [Nitzschia inconspicua]|uniref:Uncharacterized protein n=1 Tax=Nitzschia inconspicua TaxID=303405 RepID=A0A9K3PYS0_9STRA|nr:hypothetical protein IV203_037442 [Nitzschia inconspicua]
MATATSAPETFSHPDSSDEEIDDDILEKMLKKAEELAHKMSRRNSSEASVAISTEAGSDLSDPALADVTNSNNNNQKMDDPSSDNDTELEELLKQSETLLDKMRAGGLASTPEASVHSPPPADKVEPPKVSPNAPTSVYLLDIVNNYDDVSSVGSNSLRSPVVNPSLRLPSYASSTDPIQEEPCMPTAKPLSNILSTHSTTELLESAAVPTVEKKTLPLSTKIPDFTETPPDAKWEKVASASQGDDDYVPLVDYSKLSPNTTATTTSSGVHQQYDMDDDCDYDDGYAGSAAATTSRVAAFRAQKKRLQKKRRRKMAALVLGVALVGGYCWYAHQPEAKRANVETNVTTEDPEGSLEIFASDQFLDLDLDYLEKETDILADEEKPLSDGKVVEEVFEIIDDIDVTYSTQDDDNDDAVQGKSGEETIGEKDSYTVANSTDIEETKEVLSKEVQQADSTLVRKCKNPFHRIFNRKCQQLECQTDICLTKKCKNIIQRIFNHKCRVLAKQRKKRKEFQGINLQAVAGI